MCKVSLLLQWRIQPTPFRAPMLCFTNAYFLTQAGFVPQVTNVVAWTTPAFMSGYIATGSVRGMIVQLLNIIIAAACYAPFVVRYERKSINDFSTEMDTLVEKLEESEVAGEEIILTECERNAGLIAAEETGEIKNELGWFGYNVC